MAKKKASTSNPTFDKAAEAVASKTLISHVPVACQTKTGILKQIDAIEGEYGFINLYLGGEASRQVSVNKEEALKWAESLEDPKEPDPWLTKVSEQL